MIPLTAGDLKKLLKDIPDDALVSHERIEDVYFQKHRWKTEKVPDPSMPGMPNEFVDCSVAWFDKPKNKLRISAHF